MKKPVLALTLMLIFSAFAVSLFHLKFTLVENHEMENEAEAEGEQKMEYMREALLQEINKTKDPSTGIVPRERLLNGQQQINNFFLMNRAVPGISWVERGPNNIGGRTRALLFDRNDATNNTVFAGSVGGGLWKNTNISGAGSWTQVPGVLENVAITDIVQDQAVGYRNIMYFGTGETWGNLDAQRGLGIFKSTDGGATWQQIPSTNNAAFYYIQKIVINSNHDVFAATSTGIKKSTDGGVTWRSVLNSVIGDIELAANGDIYAASLYGKVYKSTAANNGSSGTWTEISPAGAYRRIEIATAPSNANTVYLLCQGSNSYDVTAIFQSTNGGTSWISRAVPNINDQGTPTIFTRKQAWYDLIASVDPNNDQTVYIAAIDVLRSTDGANSFTQISDWVAFTGLSIMHSDHHALVFVPGSSSRLIVGCDGGVYYTSNINAPVVTGGSPTPTFTAKNTNYNVTQYFAADMMPASGSNQFLAGSQDNGTQRMNAAGIGAGTTVTGGDGMFCHIDQTAGVNQIASYVYNVYYRSTNSGTSFPTTIYNDQTRGSFVNPTDYDDAADILYADGWNQSTGTGAYFRINVLTPATNGYINVTNFGAAGGGAIVTHVAVSPVTANRVYFGLASGSVVYVDNANSAASGVAGTVIKTGVGSVSCIAIDPSNENHMLVTYSNYGVQSVFESTNALAASPTWTNIENNLPDMPIRWAIFYPGNTNMAMLATELGVWSTDQLNGASTDWTPTNLNLANTRINMLKVRTADNTILAATHGRGLYTSTILSTPLPQISFATGSTTVSEQYTTATTCGRGYKDVPVTLNISRPPTGSITASIAVSAAATATNNIDYQLLTNTVTFASGSATPQSVTVRIFDDVNEENTEHIPLTYSITSGGSFAQTGTTLQLSQIDVTDNESAPNAPFVGYFVTGSFTTNLVGSSPLQSTQSDKKTQYLYRASELLANGLKAGILNSLSFLVVGKSSAIPYNGFTIKIGATANTDLSGGFASTTGFTTVYSAPVGGFAPTMGDNQFTIPSFTWDGTSNLLLEFCYDNATVGAAGTDDILSGEQTGYTSQAKNQAITGAGCSFATSTATNVFRPVITFKQNVAATTVATALNSTNNGYLGPLETVHYFDAGGRIMASIQNLSSHDYGCTSLTIDRAGASSVQFWNTPVANNAMSKTFIVTPTTNNSSGQYTITLYLTQAEVNGWQTATGQLFSNIQMMKYSGAISSITPTNPQTSNVTVIAAPTRSTMGSDYTLTATFNNGFSGFGAGIPGSAPVTLPVDFLKFGATLKNNYAVLNWVTSSEINNNGFEIEKSIDGFNFNKIGFVNAMPFALNGTSYSFNDPTMAGDVQYYRIKQIDMTRGFKYSAIVTVRNNTNIQLWVSNPFTNRIDISFSNTATKNIKAKLTDINGQLLMQAEKQNFNSSQWALDVNNLKLSNGVYILTIEENGQRATFKLMHSN